MAFLLTATYGVAAIILFYRWEIEEGKGTQQVTGADAGQRAAIPKHCSFHALSLVPDLALRLVSWWDYS